MKKNAGRFLLTFFCVFFLFGRTGLFGGNDFSLVKRPDIGIKTSIVVPIKPSLKNEKVSLSNIVSLDFSSIDLDAGFRLSTISTDSVVNFLITPLKLKYFDLGLGAGYHFYDYFKVFCEQDIILGGHTALFTKNQFFRTQLDFGVFFKSVFFKNNIIENNLWRSTIYLSLAFTFNFNKYFDMFISVSSVDYYDYAMIGTPFFKMGVNVNCNDTLSFGADYTVKLIDMVAVAENISEMLLSIYGSISF